MSAKEIVHTDIDSLLRVSEQNIADYIGPGANQEDDVFNVADLEQTLNELRSSEEQDVRLYAASLDILAQKHGLPPADYVQELIEPTRSAIKSRLPELRREMSNTLKIAASLRSGEMIARIVFQEKVTTDGLGEVNRLQLAIGEIASDNVIVNYQAERYPGSIFNQNYPSSLAISLTRKTTLGFTSDGWSVKQSRIDLEPVDDLQIISRSDKAVLSYFDLQRQDSSQINSPKDCVIFAVGYYAMRKTLANLYKLTDIEPEAYRQLQSEIGKQIPTNQLVD